METGRGGAHLSLRVAGGDARGNARVRRERARRVRHHAVAGGIAAARRRRVETCRERGRRGEGRVDARGEIWREDTFRATTRLVA